ncbi:MAG TPA: MFS transporter [Candidatus Faecousia intestinigallinarum]|nr:MFS transporter [Candidatus Faecousia intestinigallinarum]
MQEKFKLTKLEKHWILYDIGNSAFILLVSTLVPIYFNVLSSAGGLSESDYLAYWGYAGSIATIIVAVLAPICGTLADRRGFKKPLFTACLLLGALGCAALGGAWGWLSFLFIFVAAKVGYSTSLVFYDSMLTEVTTPGRMDNVSSLGYAYGYIGSVIPFILCLVVVLGYEVIGISQVTALIIAFFITAVWWIVCSLPLLRSYRQSAYREGKGNPVADAFRQLATTFREARGQKHIFLYLLAFFFFIDGVYTIINMATAYGTALGLDTTGLLLALLLTQFVAFPFSILFGRLSAKYPTDLLIKICIAAYAGITLFAMFLSTQWQFWVLAVLVGMFQGGIQALSRSYLGKIIPPERSGEYFGLMDICGKGADALGAALVAVVSQATAGMEFHVFGLTIANTGIAVGTLVVLFAIGFVLFCKADKLNKARVQV